jgi:undecaprenyl-diphosphatase
MLHVRKLVLGVSTMVALVALMSATALALTITGTPGNDRMVGSRDADTINGMGGNDRVFALAGDDAITMGAGRDRVFAGQGNDAVDSGFGNDVVVGGPGDDTILGRKGFDRLFGNDGNDNINGLADNDRIRGNAGNDILRGDNSEVGDLYSRDKLWGGTGDDQLFGGDAHDVLLGGAGNDLLNGEDGPDRLAGGQGDDTENGGNGNDRMFANQGADTLDGGPGNDRLFALAQVDVPNPGVDTVRGGDGNDVIRTSDGEADVVNCGLGSDRAILDIYDVIEDATPANPNGSCERVVRVSPSPQDQAQENGTEAQPGGSEQAPGNGSSDPPCSPAARRLPLMNILQAIVLGIVEGLTEFLPVSSTGHLTIAEKIMGLPIKADSITGFTAVVQFGAIVAVLLFFREDILRIVRAFFAGLASAEARTTSDWRLVQAVIVGTIPVVIVGVVAKDAISGSLRSLWVIAFALILWSPVMMYAESRAAQRRDEDDLTVKDAALIGTVQAVALVPGVSRSGATISAGLLSGFDRVAATRLSFFLSIPALTAAGVYELKDSLHGGVGAGPTLVGTVVAFFVAYASIAWLLRFVAHHSIAAFVPYRVAVGVIIIAVLALS